MFNQLGNKQMNNFSFIALSTNKKTGAIPVTRTDKTSCPTSCGAYAGCYAKSGPSAIHWNKLNNGGLTALELSAKLLELPLGTMWRHNEAGDLAGENESIDVTQMDLIVNANMKRKLKGFTYTHKKSDDAIDYVKSANKKGFTINISCDSMAEVEKFHKQGLPCVTISDSINKVDVINNIKLVQCPAEYNDKITCKTCKMCAIPNRDYVIKFTPHGTAKKKIVPIKLA